MVATARPRAHDDDGDNRSLVESIAAATRVAHARLNKLIISRLPLALPPQANDPSLYASGLLHITPIYTTFESLWQKILDLPPAETIIEDAAAQSDLDVGENALPQRCKQASGTPVSGRVHSMLESLRLPGLMRTERLKADIKAMTGWTDHNIIEEQLRIVGDQGPLAEFLNHIKRSVENRPHVLLAYSYIFFMALFAGGRYIRASLQSAGNEFWDQVPDHVKPTMQACTEKRPSPVEETDGTRRSHVTSSMPLRFFHFSTPTDGEDLKCEFKRKLADSEARLSQNERHDIVQEAISIFEKMTLLVEQLDVVCGGPTAMDISAAHSKAHNIPVRHAVGSIKLCPAMSSKAFPFEKLKGETDQVVPPSPHDGTVEDFMGHMRQAPKSMRITRTANWILAVAVGILVFGAYMSGRRRLSER
ncbi:uncharacterized protein F5Z01DRAFT_677440 [Emericellopsis atlantica]|uniref:Heme oxygenase n=1 Tax=Emericellopsis atlantica TaxID=2614577 RepID=A0A9P7ZF35_9HYPO|nr:uncharacterized protein F5Z01DRAFT_677440 [Emericellopsis atlantica]KAG9250943.1 hypothetical protein F5Z01DRAFT_677440 [Emericellopsis atlantica]